MARPPKLKPAIYLLAHRCPDPITGRMASHWKSYTGHVSLQVCGVDRSDGEVKPVYFEAYGEDPARAYRELTFACLADSDMLTTAVPSFAWRVGFHRYNAEQHPMEAREIARMHRVVSPLVRAYEKECTRIGQPKSFGQFVLWHLGPLDLRGIIQRGRQSFPGMFTMHTDGFASVIDHLVHRVDEDLAKLAGMQSIPPRRPAP